MSTNPPTRVNPATQEVKHHLDQWEIGIGRLEDEIHRLNQESQRQYVDQVAVMRQHLKELRLRLQALEAGEPREWRESRPAYYERLGRFRLVFIQTANRMKQEEQAGLGWLQGFTDERTHESAGWTEGIGEEPEGSAGWTEGMGHHPEGSEGWTEGYDEVNKD